MLTWVYLRTFEGDELAGYLQLSQGGAGDPFYKITEHYPEREYVQYLDRRLVAKLIPVEEAWARKFVARKLEAAQGKPSTESEPAPGEQPPEGEPDMDQQAPPPLPKTPDTCPRCGAEPTDENPIVPLAAGGYLCLDCMEKDDTKADEAFRAEPTDGFKSEINFSGGEV